MIKRKKKQWVIITFHTTAAAFQMEKTAEKYNLNGRIIPVPREISAGCGLAWRDEPNIQNQIKQILQNENIEYQQITVVTL